ncbi:BrnT family toxin [Neorhizobium galegae]|uniref:BrnT family toxin n=1 Tax=Neorhizobium galegae TaxID=399 RepID=UPI0021073BC8|nr:BrnT family toxin [Neorhizobium galegae]MCQ1852428.1 BrnT family toxin [Neorhizobium galegae]
MPRFEWDPQKARINKAKHGVSFELAELIWDDQVHMIIPDAIYDGEERWLAIGSVGAVKCWSRLMSTATPISVKSSVS